MVTREDVTAAYRFIFGRKAKNDTVVKEHMEHARDWLVALAHTRLWRKLPRSLRRAALFRLTALLAPRPALQPLGRGPIIVAGPLRTASGLGEGARLCYRVLDQCGFDVAGIDLAVLGQESPSLDFTFRRPKDAHGPGTIILHVNSPLVPLGLLQLGSKLLTHKRVIGYWAWELPSAPKEWLIGVPFVHEIWVPSRFTAEAIAPIASDRVIRIVPHPVGVRMANRRAERNVRNGVFTVLNLFNMASGFVRKNPFATIAAFRKAFGEDRSTKLIIQVSHADHYPEGHRQLRDAVKGTPNIAVMSETLRPHELTQLYESADVLLSLHRSEGFGLVIAEAMLYGIPVLATSWSGNVDFLTPENGVPVDYSLVPARDPQGTYNHPDLLWAEPDISDAAAKLRRLRENPSERARLSQRAAQDAARVFSAEAYFDTVKHSLNLGDSTAAPRD